MSTKDELPVEAQRRIGLTSVGGFLATILFWVIAAITQNGFVWFLFGILGLGTLIGAIIGAVVLIGHWIWEPFTSDES